MGYLNPLNGTQANPFCLVLHIRQFHPNREVRRPAPPAVVMAIFERHLIRGGRALPRVTIADLQALVNSIHNFVSVWSREQATHAGVALPHPGVEAVVRAVLHLVALTKDVSQSLHQNSDPGFSRD